MLALMIVLGAFLHLFIGGITYSKVQAIGRPRCMYYPRNCDSMCGHSFLAGISVVLWPATLPLMAGAVFGSMEYQNKAAREKAKQDARRANELEEARHTRALEKELGIIE